MNLKLSKEEKGITLVALMVTIIVMLILAAVTINFSTTQIRNANLQNFKTNMLLIEAKAKEYVEKANYQLGVKPEEAINNPDLLSKSQSELQGDGKGTKVDASNSIVSTLKSINISDEDWSSVIEDLKSTFLYYDKPKNKRITKDKVRRLLSKQVRSYNFSKDRIRANPELSNDLGGMDKYDFQIDKTLLRSMTFDYKRKDNLTTELKVILYDLNSIKPKNDISAVFLISNELENPEDKKIYDNFLLNAQKIAKERNYKVDLVQLDQLKDKLDKEIDLEAK